MIHSCFAAITLLVLTASANAFERPAVATVKPLLLTAIDRDEAHGVLVGPATQYVAQTFKSSAPIEIDVKMVRALRESGCARLAVTTSQDAVVDFNCDRRARPCCSIEQRRGRAAHHEDGTGTQRYPRR